LRDELDALQASLTAGGSTGAVTFRIQAKKKDFPAVLEILRQVLREPALPETEFELLKREQLAGLEQARTEPQAIAPRLLQRELAPYAKDDVRYIPTVEEEIKRVEDTTYKQVEQLYKDYLGAQAGELTIVGDFDPKTALPILEETLSGWKAKQPYSRIVQTVPPGLKGGEHKVNTPDKANATYLAGLLIPVRDDDPDYPALTMGDYILGAGSLSSRLGTRVRQKEGLSYGVGSSIGASSLDPRASFSLQAISNPQNTPKVDKAIREELDRLLTDPPTQDELDKAKQGYLQSAKVRRAADPTLAGTLSNLSHAGRTMDYYSDLEKKIEALTPEQITAALKKHINPKNLVVVTAGDFEKPAAAK
jgi:zinc protease